MEGGSIGGKDSTPPQNGAINGAGLIPFAIDAPSFFVTVSYLVVQVVHEPIPDHSITPDPSLPNSGPCHAIPGCADCPRARAAAAGGPGPRARGPPHPSPVPAARASTTWPPRTTRAQWGGARAQRRFCFFGTGNASGRRGGTRQRNARLLSSASHKQPTRMRARAAHTSASFICSSARLEDAETSA